MDKMNNKNLSDWLIAVRNPRDIYDENHFFLQFEILIWTIGLLCFLHAVRTRERHVFLWLSAALFGLVTETISLTNPDIDNFWHSQATVMLFGRHVPLYICCLYVAFMYPSLIAVSRMGLKWWIQPFAVGMSAMILDLPLDMLGVKFAFWTWRDADPAIADRCYNVPWNVTHFMLTFIGGFTAGFLGLHKLLARDKGVYQYAGFFREMICCIMAVVFGWALGLLHFVIVHHPLHDTYHVHSAADTLAVLSVYGLIVWTSDRTSKVARTVAEIDEVLVSVVLHFLFFLYLVIGGQPENVRSTGLHQTVGSCDHFSPVSTVSGNIILRRTYLCLSDFDSSTFDFHCLKENPREGQSWYTLCGTPFENRTESIVIVASISLVGLVWFWQLLRYPAQTNRMQRSSTAHRSSKVKQN